MLKKDDCIVLLVVVAVLTFFAIGGIIENRNYENPLFFAGIA